MMRGAKLNEEVYAFGNLLFKRVSCLEERERVEGRKGGEEEEGSVREHIGSRKHLAVAQEGIANTWILSSCIHSV